MCGCTTLRLGGADQIRVPTYSEEVLPNGMRLIAVKDRSLPIVNFGLLLSPGASLDPLGRSGLTYITAELLEKGTESKSADQVADAFAALGTEFGSSVDHDYVYFGIDALATNQVAVFDLFHEVLLRPKFDKKELEIFRKRLIDLIKQSYDDPDGFADHIFGQQVMGAHTYARSIYGRERDVIQVQRNEVVDFYQQIFRPDRMTLILSGDLSETLVKKVRDSFSGWRPFNLKAPASQVLAQAPADQRQIVLVDRPDLKQAQIRIGHLGIKRNDPDYWAAQVANSILGGSFTSLLMREVRVKRGLTYSINSAFSAGVAEGPFEISTFTRNDKVGETIKVSLEVYRDFVVKGVTEEDITSAKNYLKGNLIRAFEKPEDVVKSIARMQLYGLAKEDITEVLAKVSKVSVDDVNRILRKKFRPETVRVVIYASQKAVIEQVRSLGAVEVRSYREYF